MLILLPLNLIGQNTLSCQDSIYPVTKVINNDTVVLFTPKQEKCIYYWLQEKEICYSDIEISNRLINSLNLHVDSLNSKIKLSDSQINKFKSKSIIDENKITNLEKQVDIEKKLQEIYKDDLVKVKKNRNKLYVIGGIVVTGLTTALIISLIN